MSEKTSNDLPVVAQAILDMPEFQRAILHLAHGIAKTTRLHLFDSLDPELQDAIALLAFERVWIALREQMFDEMKRNQ